MNEYSPLKQVVLASPSSPYEYKDGFDQSFHYYKVDATELQKEIQSYKSLLEKHGVKVHLIDTNQIKDEKSAYNIMYCRDLFFRTPKGIIISNMFPEVRKEEPKYLRDLLKSQNIPILYEMQGDETFEGADALWVKDDLVLVGVGHRTSESALKKLTSLLKDQNIKVESVPCTHRQTQHLLGATQLIGPNTVMLRHEMANPLVVKFFEKLNFDIIRIPDNPEVLKGQAMNTVCLKEKSLYMPTDCPITKSLYEQNGIEIAGQLTIPQLKNGGGGLACATGILQRS